MSARREEAVAEATGIISGSRVRMLEAHGLVVVWRSELEALERAAKLLDEKTPKLLEASVELGELRARVRQLETGANTMREQLRELLHERDRHLAKIAELQRRPSVAP